MNSRSRPPRGGTPLRRQMTRLSDERQRRIYEFQVERVLAILDDDNLTTKAALNLKSSEGLTFECNFVESVWKDSRVVNRVAQLAGRGITADVIQHRSEVGGKRFTRAQLRIAF